jgi:16S rRNA (cytosine967-C5)-methyltransferase
VFKAEGQGVIDAFLQRRGSGEVRLDPASPGHLLSLADNSPAAQRARELPEPLALPDGFFYALLHKT